MRRFASLIAAVATVLLLASCSSGSVYFGINDGHRSNDTMAHIVEALNNQDAAALRGMFTDYALTEYSEEIDEGVAYLLSLFPNGDVIWRDPGGGDPYQAGSEAFGVLYVPRSFEVTSGGKIYDLFFANFQVNDEDPENVGIYAMGVVPLTESRDSGLEVAFHGWARMVAYHTSDSSPPEVFIPASAQRANDRMAQIVTALNRHDAAALKSMFTKYALAEHSTDIDSGLDYLLSLFPDGDIVWQEDQGGSALHKRVEGDNRTVLLPTYYQVSSGGGDYRLFFAEYAENSIDPSNVGIYAIGIVPLAEHLNFVPESDLYTWAESFDLGATGHPGIFIPAAFKADARMEQIAEALNTHDAAALKAMFSADVLEQTPELDEQLDYLLSFFPSGEVTWIQDPAENTAVEGYGSTDGGKLTEWLDGTYKLSANGNEYWLYFHGTTVNETNPDDVGLESLGVTPWVVERYTDMPGAAGDFENWTHGGRDPGIYVPE